MVSKAHWWTLDGLDGGNYPDAISGLYNAPGVPTGTTNVAGRIGNATSFANPSDHLDCGNPGDMNSPFPSYSISCWVRRASAPTVNDAYICAKGTSATDHVLGFRADVTTGYASFYLIAPGGAGYGVTSTTNVCDGTWHHLIGVKDGFGAFTKIYIDGVLNNTGSGHGSIELTSESFIIGNNADGLTLYNFGGEIDNFTYWAGQFDDAGAEAAYAIESLSKFDTNFTFASRTISTLKPLGGYEGSEEMIGVAGGDHNALYAYNDPLFHLDVDGSNVVGYNLATDTASAIPIANDLKTAFNAHIASLTYHSLADATNTVTSPNATDLASLQTLLNEFKLDFNAHMTQAGVHPTDDTLTVIRYKDAVDEASAVNLVNEALVDFNDHIGIGANVTSAGLEAALAVDPTTSTSNIRCALLHGMDSNWPPASLTTIDGYTLSLDGGSDVLARTLQLHRRTGVWFDVDYTAGTQIGSDIVVNADHLVPDTTSLASTGSMTTIGADLINDGETFTLDDGLHTAKTFEFDLAGDGVTPGNAAVELQPNVGPHGRIYCPDPVVVTGEGWIAERTTFLGVGTSGYDTFAGTVPNATAMVPGTVEVLRNGVSFPDPVVDDGYGNLSGNGGCVVATVNYVTGYVDIQEVATPPCNLSFEAGDSCILKYKTYEYTLLDGETFTLDDSIFGPEVYEFDRDGSITSDVAVDIKSYFLTTSSIWDIEPDGKTVVNDGFGSGQLLTELSPGDWVYFSDETEIARQVASVTNDDIFVLTDATARPGAAYSLTTYKGVTTATDVHLAIIRAVNWIGSTNIAASLVSDYVQLQTPDAAGASGNIPIVDTVVDSGFSTVGMGGGIDADDADAVRDAVIAAISDASDFDISASDGGAATVTLTNDRPGTAGDTTSSETVADTGFALTDMTGAADAVRNAGWVHVRWIMTRLGTGNHHEVYVNQSGDILEPGWVKVLDEVDSTVTTVRKTGLSGFGVSGGLTDPNWTYYVNNFKFFQYPHPSP